MLVARCYRWIANRVSITAFMVDSRKYINFHLNSLMSDESHREVPYLWGPMGLT